jgi:ATP-dependent helicase HrpB
VLPPGDPLAAEDWLAVAALDAGQSDARIFLAAPVELETLENAFSDRIRSVEFVAWDQREQAVVARRQDRLGQLALRDWPLANPARDKVAAAMMEGIRVAGLTALPWTPELRNWQARVLFLRGLDGDAWPDVSDAGLLAELEVWLAPFLDGMTRLTQLQRVDLAAAMRAQLSWEQQRRLDAEAPTHLTAPSGLARPLDYVSGKVPVLALRLQELFGATSTPTVAGGRIPVMLHLLSPAGRPVQVTQDLVSFWANTYDQVRRDLKGRYPKHHWPDDPMAAPPTARAKARFQKPD